MFSEGFTDHHQARVQPFAMTAYVSSLNRLLEMMQVGEQGAAGGELIDRVGAWHDNLPEVSKRRSFSMSELETALDVPGSVLGPVLLRLGWSRHRAWTAKGPYNRYWNPPAS